jgi:hypothetical protein
MIDPSELQEKLFIYLLSDSAIIDAFGTKFKLKPLTTSVTGAVQHGQTYYTAYISYQMESKKAFGVASVVATQDGVKNLEVHVNEETVPIKLKADLMDCARAYLLQNKAIRKKLGKGLNLRELTRSEEDTEGHKVCFASFEVEGSKRAGIASVSSAHDSVTDLEVFIEEEVFRVELPKRRSAVASSA